jgi:hypothetical protein
VRRLALLAALCIASPAVPQSAVIRHSGTLNGVAADDLAQVVPPERYQRDIGVVTIFSHQGVRSLCTLKNALACTKVYKNGSVLLVVPNPCPLAGKELYATILCHELGHLNGWSALHGD